MNFLKKLFSNKPKPSNEDALQKQEVNLSLDDLFVHNFIDKGGKFLYCTSAEEVIQNLIEILDENQWKNITCLDEKNLAKYTDSLSIDISFDINKSAPVFTSCEHIISDSGSVLFCSHQIKEKKLHELSNNFIVFAKTSQLVKDMGQSLSGIKNNYMENIPTNISAIKSFTPENDKDNFISTPNSNSKNLYLLLFEDF
ncbi:LUD domain-containing protein [Flavicella sp.]|uniref:LUD domain-containing protein n=1 Tax=Flavicella sp. TaxID=2957742 RepID=UPI0030180566